MSCDPKTLEKEKDCGLIPCPPIQNVTHPLRYYEFTQEEIKALEECDQESFWGRCVPMSTVFAALTYTAVRNGLLNANPHFGPVPKVAVACVLGYICGRINYLGACSEKLREDLPSSSYLSKVMTKYYSEAQKN